MLRFNKLFAVMKHEHNGKERVHRFNAKLLLLSIVLIVVVIYSYKIITPCPGERIRQDVEKLFLEIKPMPNSTPVELSPHSYYKYCHATIGNQYKAEATDQEIRKYYDAELAKHGWTFQREMNVTIWGRDHGGKRFFYCKGEYTASIETAGQLAVENGWLYDFGISWGLYNCR